MDRGEAGSEVAGARVDVPAHLTPDLFDRAHGTTARSQLVWRLAAEAYAEDYPAELQPWGMTTWWTLGRFVSGLRVGPDDTLVDLPVAGVVPGLWLARATGADLIGIDWSPAAVAAAGERAEAFVPASRARFMVGELTANGLPDHCADAVLCADAIFFAADRVAAIREVGRVLRPGGRFVFTCDEDAVSGRPLAVPDWTPLVEAGGLRVESKEVVPRWAEQLKRMYDLWLEHADDLRAELGDVVAEDLVSEATTVGPRLEQCTPLVVTARAAR